MFSCSQCDESFSTKRKLGIHKGGKHAGITCHDCDKPFASVRGLRNHQKKFHQSHPTMEEKNDKLKWLEHAELYRYLFRGILEGHFRLDPLRLERLQTVDKFLRDVAYSKSYKDVLLKEVQEGYNMYWITETIVAHLESVACIF